MWVKRSGYLTSRNINKSRLFVIKIKFYSQETQERLAKEEEVRMAIEQAKKKAEVEVKELKKDIEDLEIAIGKVRSFMEL